MNNILETNKDRIEQHNDSSGMNNISLSSMQFDLP